MLLQTEVSLTAEAILPKPVIDFLSYLTKILNGDKCRNKGRKANRQDMEYCGMEEEDVLQKAKRDEKDKTAKLRDESKELLKLVINYL